MKKALLLALVFCPLLLFGQTTGSSKVVKAIDGTINVSMFGGATYYIPLEIPQGVNGMQPKIGIAYNNQAGNGLLGYGWNINGISTINRTGSTLYHNGMMTAADFSENDCFMLDGQRLVFIGNSGNSYEYKTENDEFSKIVFTKENGYYTSCEVHLEDGNVIQYGNTSNSRLMSSDGNNVIKWMVSQIMDRNGNTVSYNYAPISPNGDIYIKRIEYTYNRQMDLDPEYTVSFTYSSNRFDSYHSYIAGNKIKCDQILNRIDVIHGNDVIGSYSFSYDGNSNRMYNLLTAITYSRGETALNPTVIQWNTDDDDIQNNSLYSQEITGSVLNKFSFVGDFNGDGYSDLLTVNYKTGSIYAVDDTVNVYLNDRYGVFNTTPDFTFNVSKYLDWIHVFDINGDGFDDIVAQTLTNSSIGNDIVYHTGFVIYESQNGNGFVHADSLNIDNRVISRVGDFLGDGHSGIMLIRLDNIDVANGSYYTIDGCPAILRYDNGYLLNNFTDSLYEVGLVVTADFDGDGKTEISTFDGSFEMRHSFYKENGAFRVATTTTAFDNYYGTAYYAGDFNNDGKSDILFDGPYIHKCIALSTGTGFSSWIQVSNNTMDNMVLPQMQTYKYSLANVAPNTSYGVNLSDIDGDGKTDIIFYNGNNKPVFFRDFHITDETNNIGQFKIEYKADNSDIKFKNQYFTVGNFLGEDHMAFIAVDPQNPSTATDDKIKIFSFPSTNLRFSVSSITDGFGNRTSIEYDYLMPGHTDFYSFSNRPYINDVKPCPIPMLAMKSYTQRIDTINYKSCFRYGNVLMHKTGRGFVNFENVEKETCINNITVKLEKSTFEYSTMGANAMALPQCDSTFVYSNGNKVLAETNHYIFQCVRCNREVSFRNLRHIARPAMLSQKTKKFNPDVLGSILSVEISEYSYNYQNDNTYANAYGCTSVQTGVNGADCNSTADCGYTKSTQISYLVNSHSDWIMNRKSEEVTVTQYSSKPAITRKTQYAYSTGNPFLTSSKTVIPSLSATDPLTVRYSYQYDGCGNITADTVSAPYGTHNEQPVVTSYTYNRYRLMASRTKDPNGLSYQEQFIYDGYDRMTSQTGVSGLTSTHLYAGPFDNQVVSRTPDNVTRNESLEWAQSSSMTYAAAGALYFKRTETTGQPATVTFFNARGNAIRTVTWNYESNPVIVDICYDEKQLPTRKSNPYFEGDTPQWTEFEYDDFGRMTGTLYPDGTIVRNMYNGLTTTTVTIADNTSRTTVQTANYLGWVASNTDASGATVTYDYYSDGKPASMTTSGGNVSIRMEYDNAGNRIMLNDPDYGETSSSFDAFGRILRQTTPKGDRVMYSYDVLGRITQKTVTGDGTSTSYQYNESSHKGTLASITHTGQTLTYIYDQYDRLSKTSETLSDTTYTTALYYDNNSKLVSKAYPSGYIVFYEYYPEGTLKNVKDARGNILWHTDATNACGQLLRATTGNGAVTTNTYDMMTNRLTGSATSNGIQNFAYVFDKFGNLTSRTDSIGGVRTESFTYDNLDRLTGISYNNTSSLIVYDSYGRMTSKQKDGTDVFSQATFNSRKPHATACVNGGLNDFPNSQSVTYTALDKVERIEQDSKIAVFTYGYNAQRTKMTITDTITHSTKTKDYVGGCEFVSENGNRKAYTYLTGPSGVFAVVVSHNGADDIYYVYKDHLGSWTAIADSLGTIVERSSFDAWGNRRTSGTPGVPTRPPKFDRGFTGHEHLYDFGLINMNGRMYDPALSSFLSPDNYMQDPTSQQGFNRYAYCMYNPLKYIDPSGEQYLGWDPSLMNKIEQEAKRFVWQCWQVVYDDISMSHAMTVLMANCLFTQGQQNAGNGSGNHGSGMGGGCTASTSFNRFQQNKTVNSKEGRCILTSLGSIYGGDGTAAWEERARLYREAFDKNPFDPNNLVEFINWNPDPDVYTSYTCEGINMSEICDAMNNGYVVSAMCDFTGDMIDYYGFNNNGHFVNVSHISVQDNGYVSISFNDHPMNTFMHDYNANQIECFDYSRYTTYNYNTGNRIRILESIRFIKIQF